MGRYISTKLFENYSVALRQWRASHSHCELLHGYALKFKVWFASNEPIEENQLDDMNWIVDYGGFKDVLENFEGSKEELVSFIDTNIEGLELFKSNKK